MAWAAGSGPAITPRSRATGETTTMANGPLHDLRTEPFYLIAAVASDRGIVTMAVVQIRPDPLTVGRDA
jgi:hypothetical protein